MGNIAFLLNCIANMGMSLFSLYSNVKQRIELFK